MISNSSSSLSNYYKKWVTNKIISSYVLSFNCSKKVNRKSNTFKSLAIIIHFIYTIWLICICSYLDVINATYGTLHSACNGGHWFIVIHKPLSDISWQCQLDKMTHLLYAKGHHKIQPSMGSFNVLMTLLEYLKCITYTLLEI